METQRPGYLFNDGVCVHDSYGPYGTSVLLGTMENILSGKVIDALVKPAQLRIAFGDEKLQESSSRESLTKLKLSALFEEPIDNIRSLMPQFNECGNVESLGGLVDQVDRTFVNKDANKILKKASTCAQW
jgi:hypothetical protein